MTMPRILFFLVSHLLVAAFGFALGIYLLPILTAPPAPSEAQLEAFASNASYQGEFKRNLKDSDWLHWGEGRITLEARMIAFRGELAPGPDYRLYLSPEFIESEDEFLARKQSMALIGEIKSFNGFALAVPEQVNIADYRAAIVWCEAFGEFITAARYR